MPQPQYSALPKWEKRQLPDPRGRDGLINIDGRQRLDIRFNQVEYKTPKHGKDHGLPVDKKDRTPRTPENVIALRDSILDMPNRKEIQWYENGQYQVGTPYGWDTVNLLDEDTNVIAVYQKQPDGSNLFLTTCILSDRKRNHFLATNGNFVTDKMVDLQQQNSWKPGQGLSVQLSNFEIDGMDENSSPNPGFTPTNSFDSDVKGITPIDNLDNSQSNNP